MMDDSKSMMARAKAADDGWSARPRPDSEPQARSARDVISLDASRRAATARAAAPGPLDARPRADPAKRKHGLSAPFSSRRTILRSAGCALLTTDCVASVTRTRMRMLRRRTDKHCSGTTGRPQHVRRTPERQRARRALQPGRYRGRRGAAFAASRHDSPTAVPRTPPLAHLPQAARELNLCAPCRKLDAGGRAPGPTTYKIINASSRRAPRGPTRARLGVAPEGGRGLRRARSGPPRVRGGRAAQIDNNIYHFGRGDYNTRRACGTSGLYDSGNVGGEGREGGGAGGERVGWGERRGRS